MVELSIQGQVKFRKMFKVQLRIAFRATFEELRTVFLAE